MFFVFSNFSGTPRISRAKSRDIRPKSLVYLGLEGQTERFAPHPFTWKTPTPPEDIRTKKFGFGFLLLPRFQILICKITLPPLPTLPPSSCSLLNILSMSDVLSHFSLSLALSFSVSFPPSIFLIILIFFSLISIILNFGPSLLCFCRLSIVFCFVFFQNVLLSFVFLSPFSFFPLSLSPSGAPREETERENQNLRLRVWSCQVSR